jgi:NMD protein affecting ribosome stability and mRNA decay
MTWNYQYCSQCGKKKRRLQEGFCIDCWFAKEKQ